MALEFRRELGGRPLVLEFGELAQQANGSVLVRYGETVVLVTVTMSKEPRQGIDFSLLLSTTKSGCMPWDEFLEDGAEEKDGRAKSAILAARMIDRPLRPLFPDGFRNDVQVVVTVLSVDYDNDPTIAGMIGASAALHVSDIPFSGPVAGINVGLVNGEYIINPTLDQQTDSILDLTVAGTKDAVMMVEAGAKEVTEEQALGAIMFAHDYIKELCLLQEEIRSQIGKPKVEVQLFEPEPDMEQWVRDFATERLKLALRSADKQEREQAVDTVREKLNEAYIEAFGEEIYEEKAKDVGVVFDSLMKEEVRRSIIFDKTRPDGRRPDEIRPISSRVGILPRAHGSGLFTRGQTQVLTVCTLGLKSDEQQLDNLTDEESKRYIHHYNFPAYSVGEVRPIRGPGRREIGHGALAERALLPVIPSEEDFPYTIRLVSEVVESNGSTSQASVCGSTLALMDAGVPIKQACSRYCDGTWVMHGMSSPFSQTFRDSKNALGDMDFKVAGNQRWDHCTADGYQDYRREPEIEPRHRTSSCRKAVHPRQDGRKLLNQEPELSPYSPWIITMEIPRRQYPRRQHSGQVERQSAKSSMKHVFPLISKMTDGPTSLRSMVQAAKSSRIIERLH